MLWVFVHLYPKHRRESPSTRPKLLEPIQNPLEEQDRAAEMKEALKHGLGAFPADAEAAEVLEPADGAFDRPAAFVAAQRPAILGDVLGTAAGTVGRNHLHPLFGQLGIEPVAVIGLVTNESPGRLGAEHESEKFLHQAAFMRIGRSAARGHGQASGVDHDHDLDAFAGLGAADPVATALGLGKGAINEAFIEFEAALLFHAASGLLHQRLEDAALAPLAKPPVDGALAAELGRQILPLGPVVEHPEDAGDDLALVGGRTPAQGAAFRVGYLPAQPVQRLVAQSGRPFYYL